MDIDQDIYYKRWVQVFQSIYIYILYGQQLHYHVHCYCICGGEDCTNRILPCGNAEHSLIRYI